VSSVPGLRPLAMPQSAEPRRAALAPSAILAPLALALWAVGLSQAHVTRLGPYGLPPALPVVCYAGVGVLLISAAAERARANPAPWRMAIHAAGLQVMLYATAPLLYPQGRYEWMYKTVGVVQYVNAHGQLDSRIDIYQNWPGFFALAAWFTKVAGVGSPLAYAKWAQPVFELAALPLLYLIYQALGLSQRQLWIAVLLYSGSNWIGQDYFSPQALGTVLGLGIMAIAVRWLYLRDAPASRLGRRGAPGRHGRGHPPMTAAEVLACAALLALFAILTFTHELSPYMLAVQLGTLAALNLLRPRWLPAALAAIAVGYLLPRLGFVDSHYGLFSSLGNFFSNATPPSFAQGVVSPAQHFIERCAEALSLGVWLLAVLGGWRRWRHGNQALTLLLLAFSPVILLALQAYGHEGILRVYLFSLPWSAALAAMALVPVPAAVAEAAPRKPGWSLTRTLRPLRGKLMPGSVRGPLAVGCAVALFFPAFFGNDSFNVMSTQEVDVVTSFWRTARPGLVYLAIDNAPVADTYRYNLFPLSAIFGSDGVLGDRPVTADAARVIARYAAAHAGAGEPAYVLVTSSMATYDQSYGVARPGSFRALLASLARSRAWRLIIRVPGVTAYELRP
jgi:hypothetical protein